MCVRVGFMIKFNMYDVKNKYVREAVYRTYGTDTSMKNKLYSVCIYIYIYYLDNTASY